MSFQNNDQSDFDFSIIDHKDKSQGKLNFSVESLLTQGQPSVKNKQQKVFNNQQQLKNSGKNCTKNIQQPVNQQNNSFLNDLQKFQKSLSFQTQIYNVYQQQSNQQINTKSYLHGKSNSHLKTTKQNSNQLMKSYNLMYEYDYGHLIIDFTKKKQKFKEIQNKNKLKNIQKQKLKLKRIKSMQNFIGTKISKNIITKAKTPKDKIKKTQLVNLISPRRSKSKQYSQKTKITSSNSRNSLQNKMFSPKIGGKSLYFDSSITKNNTSTTTLQYSKDKKRTINSLRQSNPYNQYFGVDINSGNQMRTINSGKIKGQNKLISVSNISNKSCKIVQINTPKYNVNINKGNLIKKRQQKSKQKSRIESPLPFSNKNQALKFKKKKI